MQRRTLAKIQRAQTLIMSSLILVFIVCLKKYSKAFLEHFGLYGAYFTQIALRPLKNPCIDAKSADPDHEQSDLGLHCLLAKIFKRVFRTFWPLWCLFRPNRPLAGPLKTAIEYSSFCSFCWESFLFLLVPGIGYTI